MKKLILILLVCFSISPVFSQISNNQINELIKALDASGKSKEDLENTVNGIINNPELYNSLWKNFIDQAFHKDSATWLFLKDMNVRFKTFETTDNPGTALGFTYDFNFDYATYREADRNRISSSFGISAKGNVAFKKALNPVDFLETKAFYSYSHFIGGIVKKSNDSIYSELNRIEDKLAAEKNMQGPAATALWEEFGKNLELSNQYYYAFAPKFAFESNQDFSRNQFSPGIAIDLGVKAWNTTSTLSHLNIFDYPFALLRLITGTDKKFTPYGSTLPILQVVVDYVIPSSDTTRERLAGNLNPFPRITFETSFRTFIKRIGNENIFFNANFRYFHELNAPEPIVQAKLDFQSYFIMTLQSSSGFYVSYAKGKLPFDLYTDQTYSIGFNYKFN